MQSDVAANDVLRVLAHTRMTFVAGVCVCETGFQGNDCGEVTGKVPVIDIPLGGLCDVSSRTCQQATVMGDEFHNNDQLKCRVVPQIVIKFR